MARRSRLVDPLRAKGRDVAPGITIEDIKKTPIGESARPSEKAVERPFVSEAVAQRRRQEESTKKIDEAMARYLSMEAGKAKSNEQDAALKRLSTTLGYETNAPLQYEDFFKRFREDENLNGRSDRYD